ncbi:MAG TPA: L,D-transpeptidase family protein [Cyclobacteriaceae bacterium]|nr:L,D-transpeptidase family protein [Cyclobacteriaceae bacterium]
MCYRGTAVTCVRRFYEQRQNILLWTANDKPMNRADSVITFIGNLRYYGLLPENYHFEEIQNLRKELGSGENILRFEALLTDSYIAMVRHIWLGRTAAVTPQADSVAISLLESAFREGGIVNNIIVMENSLSGYRSLKIGLRLFLDSLSQEQRQAALLNSASDAEVNKSIQTIEVNLERWRKEKQVFGDRYIFVNIPEFMLYLIENDSVILESKIIVGTPEKQTPEFSSILECFITYPYWYVPRKIAIEEYLPAIQADTSFLNRNNFDVLNGKGHVLNADSIDWKRLNENYFPVRLRQREGPENALGIIKFTFDNPYAVFLHDTNVKRLFRSKVRAFSHGCIRVEKAVELSHYLVTGDLNKKSKYVERFLKEESRHTVELQRPIPIHIRYFTCYFRKGQLKCYDDIYQKDSLVGNQLYASKTGPGF